MNAKKKNCFLLVVLSILLCLPFSLSLPAEAAYENTHVNTGDQATDLVEVARTQVGYHEGTNNYTKYNVWFGSLNDYGYNYAWCQTFVAWCANQAGIPTSMIPRVSGTISGMDFFKKNETWKDAGITPEKGDIIYLHSKSSSGYHVGIVADVSGGQISTIEGNSSDRVAERTYSVGNSSIVGYGCPEYVRPNPDPPKYASVSLWKNCYMVGEDVTFNMSSDTGTVFTLGIDDKDGNRLYTYDTGFDNPSTSKTYTRSFDTPGEYSCWITTYNAVGRLDSERFYFIIYDKKPEYANISLYKNSYMVGEDVTFNMSSDTGIVFTLGIDDKDGNRLYTYDTGFDSPSTSKTYTRSFDTPGEYSCWITTYNAIGSLDSERFHFIIYDKKPEYANVSLYKNSYMVGEDVTFNMSSDTGMVFTLGIDDKDGNRLYTYDTGFDSPSTSKTYTRSFDTPGEYSCWITTYNAIGSLDSERFYFTVLSKIDGDCNNDGQFSIADIIALQKWLLNDDTELANWQAADFSKDNILNIFDLCIMKNKLLSIKK